MAARNDMTVRGGETAASPAFRMGPPDPIVEDDPVTDHDNPPRQVEGFITRFIRHLLTTLSAPNV